MHCPTCGHLKNREGAKFRRECPAPLAPQAFFMATARFIALLWALLAILSPVSDCRADPAGTTDCPDEQTCRFPTPEECAAGDNIGVWDGGPAGRGAVCVGGSGHVALYVGGNPLVPCGQVIVADENVLEGPTAGWGSDPNAC